MVLGREKHDVVLETMESDEDFEITALLADNDEPTTIITNWQPGEKIFSAQINGQLAHFHVSRLTGKYQLTHSGTSIDARLLRPFEADLLLTMPEKEAADTSKLLLCPMPGLVVSIPVEVGQKVQAGEPLASVEAMKMENVLRAERDVTISAINVEKGDSLAVDAIIMEFE